MNRTVKNLRSRAGTSHTKAFACHCCGKMRPVSIQQWNAKTEPGSVA